MERKKVNKKQELAAEISSNESHDSRYGIVGNVIMYEKNKYSYKIMGSGLFWKIEKWNVCPQFSA